MKEEKILVNNLEINYRKIGEGEPLLILHGWGGSSSSWIKIQNLLAQNYQVIVPDLPGFGKSTPPQQPWGIEDYCNFVLDLIQKLNLDSFYLVGHSFGGGIAVKFTAENPQPVRSLILCAPAGIKPEPGLKTKLFFWAAKLGEAIFSLRPLVRFKDKARNYFYTLLRNRDYGKANQTMKETMKKVLSYYTNLNSGSGPFLDDLTRIKPSTLLIWGDRDKLVSVEYARIFKRKIRNSELEVFSKVGHSPHLEAPDQLSRIISNFLS